MLDAFSSSLSAHGVREIVKSIFLEPSIYCFCRPLLARRVENRQNTAIFPKSLFRPSRSAPPFHFSRALYEKGTRKLAKFTLNSLRSRAKLLALAFRGPIKQIGVLVLFRGTPTDEGG